MYNVYYVGICKTILILLNTFWMIQSKDSCKIKLFYNNEACLLYFLNNLPKPLLKIIIIKVIYFTLNSHHKEVFFVS